MRHIDLWFVAFNVWLAAAWHRANAPAWIAVAIAIFLLCGMVYIYKKRKAAP